MENQNFSLKKIFHQKIQETLRVKSESIEKQAQ